MVSDEDMRLNIGELALLDTDSGELVGYKSLTTEEKGLERRDHCWRKAPPSNEIITGHVKVIRRINPLESWREKRMR